MIEPLIPPADRKPILCLDFDGVIHAYDSGWQGATVIRDHVTPGFFEWLDRAAQRFRIVIYSSRSKEPGATDAMALWLAAERKRWRDAGGVSPITDGTPVALEFAHEKPPAFLTIDDRALTFSGRWSDFDPDQLLQFTPWNKTAAAPIDAADAMDTVMARLGLAAGRLMADGSKDSARAVIAAADLIRQQAADLDRLRGALDLAVSRGCNHCADSIRQARAEAWRE